MEFIVTSNKNIPYRVKEKNLHLVPRNWHVNKNTKVPPYYNKLTGKISQRFKAVIELKNEEQVKKLIDRDKGQFELLFGRLSKYAYGDGLS